jgi:hypothetical protein
MFIILCIIYVINIIIYVTLFVHLCRMVRVWGYRLLDEFYNKNHHGRAIDDNLRLVQ